MIGGLVQILLFQGIGEIISKVVIPLIPGPVIGLLLLLGWLAIRKGVSENVDAVATTLVQHLGLLFVPAAVGVVLFWPQLKAQALPVVAALVGSVVLTVAVPALILKLIAKDGGDAK